MLMNHKISNYFDKNQFFYKKGKDFRKETSYQYFFLNFGQ